jgi:predicted amidophosphoribosyltransferase
MIRVFVAAFLVAVVISVVFLGGIWILPIFIILFALIAVANLGKLKCPHCRKRVKLGAGVCHHCGREVKAFVQRLAGPRGAVATTTSARRPVMPQQPVLKSVVSRCNGCGAVLHIGSRFCSSCGATVEFQQQPVAIRTIPTFCSTCGARIRNSQGICVHCTENEREQDASV